LSWVLGSNDGIAAYGPDHETDNQQRQEQQEQEQAQLEAFKARIFLKDQVLNRGTKGEPGSIKINSDKGHIKIRLGIKGGRMIRLLDIKDNLVITHHKLMLKGNMK